VASDEAEKQFNKTAQPHAFLTDQLVLLDEHSFLAKNQKLAPKWSGPHKILRLKGDCNIELLLRHNNKKLITHVNRLKPYFVQSPAAVSSPDFFPLQKEATPPPVPQQKETEFEKFFPYEDEILEEVNYPPPSPPTRLPRENLRHHRTTSSSSSVYGDIPEVTRTDPSPSHQLTYADVANRPRQHLSSSSSASTCLSLPSNGVALRTRSHLSIQRYICRS
jgi:hypothetical protein